MNTKIIAIGKEDLLKNAKKDFVKLCGFDLNKSKHQRMMDRANQVLEDGIHSIDIKALIADFDGSKYKDKKITINDTVLECNFFSQIPDDKVVAIYFSVITVGECWFASEEEIMNFLYADNWGTVFVDVASEKVKEYIRMDMKEKYEMDEGKNYYMSKALGPGYFGMGVTETNKIKEIIDFDSIGVKVKDSGLMIPQKSCVDIYFLLNEDIHFPVECSDCVGNKKGCQNCKINPRRYNGEKI
ncbi:MAG TPA: hypothetical protein VJ916_08890 [Anaerovoracaceae bacterium]|nr:hypothetical protein [Anaerovoracaceae bacterium]